MVGLEILLSADNAIVMAILVRHLPHDQQKRALFYGLAGAFFFRAIAILAATWLIGLWWVQLLGALYLIYLGAKHFMVHHAGDRAVAPKKAGFWLTVLYVELTDIAFAIDSVLVAVATEPAKNKIWVVYVGAMAGVLALRWAARVFLVLLKRYPVLEHMAYLLVAWAGVKLLCLGGHTLEKWMGDRWTMGFHVSEMQPLIFWIGVGIICAWGVLRCVQTGPNIDETPAFETEVEQLGEEDLP
ncbi:MAG: hypothetical protein JNK63_04750 [Chthonomonas sp.]|nr:hypothetical protein [Chthonomonas sp.]